VGRARAGDPRRAGAIVIEAAFVATLARAADPAAIPALRELVAHASAEIRLLAQIGLARAGDADPATVESRLVAEPDVGVYTLVAARAGRVALAPGALDYLAAQAIAARTPVRLRAECAWALGEHDPARAAELAATLGDESLRLVAAIARRRAGDRTTNDRVSDLLGW
jgi:hypothetical protein